MMMEEQAAAPVEQASTEKAPVFISKEDRLEAENLHLRAIMLAQKETMIQMQVLSIQKQRLEAQAALLKLQEQLAKKYGVDLNTHEVRSEDGAVIPRASSAPQTLTPSQPQN